MKAAGLALAVVPILAVAPAAAGAQASAEQSQAQPVAILRLTPPIGQSLVLTIADRRLLPSGESIDFAVRMRIMFVQRDAGLLASVERIGLDCSGDEARCAAFRAALPVGPETIRHFAVGRDGSAALLTGDLGLDAAPGLATQAVARMEADSPGSVSAAELREAMRFVGRAAEAGEVVESEWIGVGEARLHRSARIRIDPATGLVTHRLTHIRLRSDEGRIISERRWTLVTE